MIKTNEVCNKVVLYQERNHFMHVGRDIEMLIINFLPAKDSAKYMVTSKRTVDSRRLFELRFVDAHDTISHAVEMIDNWLEVEQWRIRFVQSVSKLKILILENTPLQGWRRMRCMGRALDSMRLILDNRNSLLRDLQSVWLNGSLMDDAEIFIDSIKNLDIEIGAILDALRLE